MVYDTVYVVQSMRAPFLGPCWPNLSSIEHLKVFFHLCLCQELQDLAKQNGAAQPLATKGGGGGGGDAEVRKRSNFEHCTISCTSDSDMLGPQYVPGLALKD